MWADDGIPESEWTYYLRNYLLRHLLEFHYQDRDIDTFTIDLVLDRIMLTEIQRKNTLSYLNSNPEIGLKRVFSIPHIEHLTIADSKYVNCLQISHILTDMVKNIASGKMTEAQAEYVSTYFKVMKFN